MKSYRIVCTEQEPADQSHYHAHIVAVGVGERGNQASKRFTLSEVLKKMDAGDQFFTIGEKYQKKAFVIEFICCGKRYIKTEADAYKENNLDELRRCSWKTSQG